jgi:O-methyltransferase
MLKKIVPLFLRNFYSKLNWFLKYYHQISFTKKLVNNTDQLLPVHLNNKVTYNTDGLVTSNNCDFIEEPRFKKAYAAAAATNPWSGFTLQWRVYNICWFADYVKKLEGDFVECGVNTGAYARAIVDYIDFNTLPKKFYLLDTFAGIPVELITEKEKSIGLDKIYQNNYADVYEQVVKTFTSFNVKIIKGRVPDTLPEVDAQKIALLSIDMNMVEPEIAAINFFWDKLVPGAVVILDDYGFPPHINQKIAFDAFALSKNVHILSMPTGQGILFKPA